MISAILDLCQNETRRCVYRILCNTYSAKDFDLARRIYEETTPRGVSKRFCEEVGLAPKYLRAFRETMEKLNKTTLSQEQLPVDISEDRLLLLIGGDSFG